MVKITQIKYLLAYIGYNFIYNLSTKKYMNAAIQEIERQLKRRRRSDRPSFLLGIYTQIVPSRKFNDKTQLYKHPTRGMFRNFINQNQTQGAEFATYFASMLNKFGLDKHAKRVETYHRQDRPRKITDPLEVIVRNNSIEIAGNLLTLDKFHNFKYGPYTEDKKNLKNSDIYFAMTRLAWRFAREQSQITGRDELNPEALNVSPQGGYRFEFHEYSFTFGYMDMIPAQDFSQVSKELKSYVTAEVQEFKEPKQWNWPPHESVLEAINEVQEAIEDLNLPGIKIMEHSDLYYDDMMMCNRCCGQTGIEIAFDSRYKLTRA